MELPSTRLFSEKVRTDRAQMAARYARRDESDPTQDIELKAVTADGHLRRTFPASALPGSLRFWMPAPAALEERSGGLSAPLGSRQLMASNSATNAAEDALDVPPVAEQRGGVS